MAEESAGDKTEEATEHKRDKERERGQAAKSKDLLAASVLLASVLLLWGLAKNMYGYLTATAIRVLGTDMGALPAPHGNEVMPYIFQWIRDAAYAGMPFLIALLFATMVAGVAQVGFMFAWEPLQPDVNKLNPVKNLQRIFSLKGVVNLVMNFMKLGLVAAIAWVYIARDIPAANNLATSPPGQILAYTAYSVWLLALILAAILFFLGLLDMAYQVYQRNQDMRMTKQEVLQEHKDIDGDPHIRARRRQIQREMAMQRMMQEVPEAEVVVRNPTHYAVALKFKPEMAAPEVVAKGMNLVAKRIIDVAIENGVPLYQDPPLARQLYRQVEIGGVIPPALFTAVAEVMGYVLRGSKAEKYIEESQHLADSEHEREPLAS